MFIRIDDRLIHGQVVTAWLNFLKTKVLVVADDQVASNLIFKKALTMATPSGVKLMVESIEKITEYLRSSEGNSPMVIVRYPVFAEELIRRLPEIKWEVNVGNVGKAEGRRKITNSVYLDEANYDALKRLQEKGVQVYFQTVPTQAVQNLS